MKRSGSLAALFALSICVALPSLADAAEQNVRFAPGATSKTLKGTIRGSGDASYIVQAAAGQVMQVLFKPSNRSCYFNGFEPGATDAAHIGSTSGNEFGASPTKAGAYKLQVYLMRNAARRNETCRYQLSIELTGAPGGASAGISDRQMRDACVARAAQMYGVPSARINLAAIRSLPAGPAIDGTINKGAEGIKKMRCLYTPARDLRDVMALTPDGE